MRLPFLRPFNRLLKRWPKAHDQFSRVFGRFFHHTKARQAAIDRRDLQDMIRRAVRAHRDEVTFVEIGANDGVNADFLRDIILSDARWRGLMVEPVPFLFELLVKSFRGVDRVKCVNVAIAEKREVRKFYYVDPKVRDALGPRFRAYLLNLGSFDKNHLERHRNEGSSDLIDVAKQFVVEQDVSCMPLRDVLAENGVPRPAVLVVDTEGYDYEVIRQFDFASHKPDFVIWEHIHLSDADRASAVKLVQSFGYRTMARDRDTIATLR